MTALLILWLFLPAQAETVSAAQAGTISQLRDQARDILERVESQDIALTEARTEVEHLRRRLIEIGKQQGWAPTRRALEMPVRRPEQLASLDFDDCPLFFEEELVELCPLDLGRSEIWGDQMVVCGFLCAPRLGD